MSEPHSPQKGSKSYEQEHAHGPPSMDAGGVKRILWVLYAIVALFIAIDVVWFGPDWVSNLGQDTHHVASGEAEHGQNAPEEHWPDTPTEHAEPAHDQAHGFGGHKHGHYGFEKVPTFHALYGFAGCVLLVLAARVLRLVVMRDEDYYGEDAPLDADTHEEGGHA